MALSDWDPALRSSVQGATTDRAAAGSYSYKFEANHDGALNVLKQSKTDAPAEGKVVTKAYFPGPYDSGAVTMRFQDTNNFYVVHADPNDSVWRLFKAGYTQVDTISGGCPTDTWFDLEVIFWEDAGTFYVRVKTGGTAVGDDLVDSGNAYSSGGGVGVADYPQSTSDAMEQVFFDETEIFY